MVSPLDPRASVQALAPFDGAALSLAWGLPFAGLILWIALAPLVAPKLWHHHYGKIAGVLVVALLIPFAATFGTAETVHNVVHAIVLEYVPFFSMLFALFTIAGGIRLKGTLAGTPGVNTALLALGAALASVMGTTGASMLLIRPLLSANETRAQRVHAVVFFILLVGNVGGALSPLGDPPLFIGFLRGVDFFWTTRVLALPTLFLSVTLLAVFYALDAALYRREGRHEAAPRRTPLSIEGMPNFLLLASAIGAVLVSGLWNPGIALDVAGATVQLEDALRSVLLVGLGMLSVLVTPAAVRAHNQFHWAPIVEVAKLFAAIFITIFPVLAMLEAGRDGPLAKIFMLVSDGTGERDNVMVFWLTGLLSAFLDNAPTYLVFFNLSGGDAEALMREHAQSLAALSMGAVYFGALTYIGNAPNFMIKAIAEDRGVAMPSFFGYLGWASLALLPLLAVVAAVWL
jgi:Na+/H+ antiporter NhaD/arsenite permease-like protein